MQVKREKYVNIHLIKQERVLQNTFFFNSIYSSSMALTDSLCVYFPRPVFIRVKVNAGIITEAVERQWEN